ncbi:MAG: hypothetical protein ACK4S6_12280 [Roseateles asaccharophilus]|uniref:Uncharacterized protein n=1 Tax=Roseateles asaccharophilus TaxID=582607 RepID=A0A4R6MWD5_9BURK|nr:hypothetical protein [Roseateles asaccharophilus]MDN3544408.1 hypothetical protein [Roseateles asaccharophilus]TDP06488.1 hypothetical protein DFR39_109169 [Roseateles asaccharophilus]
MLASLVSLLPGSTTFAARRAQKDMLRGNRVRQEHKPTLLNRQLFWAARHPILFVLEVATLCALFVAYAWPCIKGLMLACAEQLPVLTKLTVVASDWEAGDVDVGAFIGVVLGVQGTLVALVYPLVFSFVSVFLQRRAKSEVALRIYTLSSGVVPAGASSLALLSLLTVAYFGTPILKGSWADLFEPFLVLTGSWFLLNIVMSALFLARTLKYLQADEQRAFVWKAAIGVIYFEEMRESLRQGIAGQRLMLPARDGSTPRYGSPSVRPVRGGPKSVSCVTRNVTDGAALAEVFLPTLEFVARSWLRRTAKKGVERATLDIGVTFGRTEGVQYLAAVSDGPPLLWWERALVSTSFFYTGRPSRLVSATTSGLLSEMASTAVTLADQGQFADAAEMVLELSMLVADLLKSGQFTSVEGDDNTALLSEARYVWWGKTFLSGWTQTFSDISSKALEVAPKSTEMFRATAYVAPRLLAATKAANLNVANGCMGVFTHLDFQLSDWWRRNAVKRNEAPEALPQLSAVNQTLYDELLAIMVGVWSDVTHSSDLPMAAPDADVWNAAVGNGQLLRLHLDTVAAQLCKAVERGDLTASRRYCDLFLKWGGFNLKSHSTDMMSYLPGFSRVGMSLLNLSWEDARFELATDDSPADVGTGTRAVTLAVRRYYEAMRLQLILILLETVPADDEAWSPATQLGVDMAVALLQGEELHRGANVEVDTIHASDDVLERLIHAAFIDRSTSGFLESFSSSLHRDKTSPDVAGWGFAGSMPRLDIAGYKAGWTRLLGMFADSAQVNPTWMVRKSNDLLARAWRDLQTLSDADILLSGLAAELTLDSLLANPSQRRLIDRLRERMGKDQLGDAQVLAASSTCAHLASTARWHRHWTIRCTELTQALKDAFVRGVIQGALHPKSPSPFGSVREGLVLSAAKTYTFELLRESFAEGAENAESHGRNFGNEVRARLEEHAIHDVVEQLGATAVEEPTWPEDYSDTRPVGVFVDRVGAAVQRSRAAGVEPAVLAGNGRGGKSLRPEMLRGFAGREPAQTAHQLEREEVGGVEKLFIHGAPILSRRTPDHACYVVPLACVESLVVAPGTLEAATRDAEWTAPDERELQVHVVLSLYAEYPLGEGASTTPHRPVGPVTV